MTKDFHRDDVANRVTSSGVDPLVGQVLDGRFKIVESIGVGGMGKVYRAVQRPLNRAVALKVLDYNYGAGKDEAFRQRFLVEAAMTAKLSHPNTITVIDYGCSPTGIFYIAMEYLDGRTLDQVVIEDGPIEWRRVVHIGQQVCRSLREAHNLGVVHRDLKPANVMLLHADDDTDQVKVLDFGLVKSFVVGQELEGRAITQHGMLMGSPPYMAPEQGELNHADPRSDIYSLGTVLYEALTGAPPFTGRSAMEVILKHVHQPVPPMRVTGAPVPREMEILVGRCLAKSPMDRFQSMDEVIQALQELSAPHGIATPTDGIPVQLPPERGNRFMPLVLFVVAVTLGATVATIVIRSARPEATSSVSSPAEAIVPPMPSSDAEKRRAVRAEAARVEQAEAEQAEAEQAEAEQAEAAKAEAEQAEAAKAEAAKAEAAKAEAAKAEAAKAEAAKAEAAKAEAAKAEAAKAEAAKAEAAKAEAAKAEAAKAEAAKAEAAKAEAAKAEAAKAKVALPVKVTFRVETDPRGASVSLNGKGVVGRTPLDIQVPVSASGTAHAEFALSLAGHQLTTISASGQTGRVLVREKLRLLSAKPIADPPAAAAPKKKPQPKKSGSGNSAKLGNDDGDENVVWPRRPEDLLKKSSAP